MSDHMDDEDRKDVVMIRDSIVREQKPILSRTADNLLRLFFLRFFGQNNFSSSVL
jgi:hypothetical protein